jgi:multidrug efflux pump subunit AcrA (membrane-fusion protein)
MRLRARPEVRLAADAVILHRRAVMTENNQHYVYIYDNGVTGKRFVQTGPSVGDNIQILSGLSPGQLVVMP